MPLHLPPSYTVQTKNETVVAVLNAISASVEIAEKALAFKNIEECIKAIAEGYYYAGFACGLTVVSTSELPEDKINSINNKVIELNDLHSDFVRKNILSKAKPTKLDLIELETTVKIPNLGISGGSAMSGWENPKAKESLVLMIINQLIHDRKISVSANKVVKAGKNLVGERLADLATVMFNGQFLFGILDGLKFTKLSDLEEMKEKIILGERYFTPLELIDGLKKSAIQYSPLDAIVSKINSTLKNKDLKKSLKSETRISETKVTERVTAKSEESGNYLARYYNSCFR